MIFFDPEEPGWFSCTGTLLDADTFLTAGHCTYPVGTDGQVTVGHSGGNDVWVTFDETEVLAGWPPRADYPTEEALYEPRSAWPDANPDYYEATAIPHPDYDNFSGFPANDEPEAVQTGATPINPLRVTSAANPCSSRSAVPSGRRGRTI